MQILNRDLEQRLFALRRGRQGMKRQTQSHRPNLSRFFHLLLSLFALFCVGANRRWRRMPPAALPFRPSSRSPIRPLERGLGHRGSRPGQRPLPCPTPAHPLGSGPHQHTGIEDYFKGFLSQHPNGRIDQRVIQSDCNVAIDAGNYSFELDGQGWVKARYTFVYAYRDGECALSTTTSLLP